MLKLFKPRVAETAGRMLYVAVVEQARQPRLYTDLGAPDTTEGRFELYSLHVILLLDRLKRQGEQAAETAQALFDTYVQSLDDALREIGVGDTSVGKKMRKLGEAFFGRVKSYEEALAALPDRAPLEALIARTVFAGGEAAPATSMVDYLLAQREALAANPLEGLQDGRVAWGQA
jgi:cytochrome b pre-mRNA-processing protein 3